MHAGQHALALGFHVGRDFEFADEHGAFQVLAGYGGIHQGLFMRLVWLGCFPFHHSSNVGVQFV